MALGTEIFRAKYHKMEVIKIVGKTIGQCYVGMALGYLEMTNLAKWYFTK